MKLRGTFRTAARSANVSDAVAVRLVLGDGTVSYGEAVPLANISGETVESVLAAVAKASELLVGESIGSFRRLARAAQYALPACPAARAGIEIALLAAFSKSRGIAAWRMLGGSTPTVSTDVTIPMVEPDEAAAFAEQASAQGFEILKLKVGGEDDMERLRMVAKAAPNANFILDANQAFDAQSALAFLKRVPFDIQRVRVFEQPVPAGDLAGLRKVAAASPVPVYADEAVKTPADALDIAKFGAASGINVKIQKTGILGTLDTAAICRTEGLSMMIGCMLESAVGLSASAHLACGLGEFAYVDLDADLLIEDDIGTLGFERNGPQITITDRPGFGAEPPAGVFDQA